MLTLMILQENAPAVSIDGHENVPANNEDALLKAVANQPVSVAIDAGGSDFQFYSEVNYESICKEINKTWYSYTAIQDMSP